MGTEIERKFLVKDDRWRSGATGKLIRQGYLCADGKRTVRVRTSGNEAWITIKGPTVGIARAEFEYAIPLKEAEAMLDTLCARPLIEKTRWCVEHAGLVWEVDEFAGENAGLIVAEVELEHAEQALELPPWAGREVSGESKYSNSSLVKWPYSRW